MPNNKSENANPQTNSTGYAKGEAATPIPASGKPAGDIGEGEMQEKFDEAAEKGYFGEKVDPTPNEAYTVEGVVAEQPTPETDPELAAEAANAPKAIGERISAASVGEGDAQEKKGEK
jgi:hypothetical protein